jgi:hypothetical protein
MQNVFILNVCSRLNLLGRHRRFHLRFCTSAQQVGKLHIMMIDKQHLQLLFVNLFEWCSASPFHERIECGVAHGVGGSKMLNCITFSLPDSISCFLFLFLALRPTFVCCNFLIMCSTKGNFNIPPEASVYQMRRPPRPR